MCRILPSVDSVRGASHRLHVIFKRFYKHIIFDMFANTYTRLQTCRYTTANFSVHACNDGETDTVQRCRSFCKRVVCLQRFCKHVYTFANMSSHDCKIVGYTRETTVKQSRCRSFCKRIVCLQRFCKHVYTSANMSSHDCKIVGYTRVTTVKQSRCRSFCKLVVCLQPV